MKNRFTPLLMAVSAVIGIVIGTFLSNHFLGNRLSILNEEGSRLNNLLYLIDDMYVDSVNINDLVDRSIPEILQQLDPHSAYITAKDVAVMTDDLKGSFSGVGIEFNIQHDTIYVANVITDGPAERAGIMPGDKIVTIDGKEFVGKICTNEEAMHRLKGAKGSKVRIGVKRYGSTSVKDFELTRDEIHTTSISASYMLDDKAGYVRIKNFGENTYAEMLVALAQLEQEGLESLVIDLRDNTGGYLESAVQIVNEFLPEGRLITYTQGRKMKREEYKSDGRGVYQQIPLVVLINESSASASEIFAGAIQDNDRGTVIGRRSFGKGLVQRQMEFPDGALIRLTVARYYTPSGRCIQKPYTPGDAITYENDILNRYNNGEFFSQENIKHEGPEFKTVKGRTVYGGGGITPDIFVAEDTLGYTSYYKEAAMSGLILQYAFDYTDQNRQKLTSLGGLNPLVTYLNGQGLVEKFVTFADGHGLQRRNLLINKSHNLIHRYLVSRVVYNILDEKEWVRFNNSTDETVLKALEVLNKGTMFP